MTNNPFVSKHFRVYLMCLAVASGLGTAIGGLHELYCTQHALAAAAPKPVDIVWFKTGDRDAVKILQGGDWYYSEWSSTHGYHVWYDEDGEQLSNWSGMPFIVDAPEMKALYDKKWRLAQGKRLIRDSDK